MPDTTTTISTTHPSGGTMNRNARRLAAAAVASIALTLGGIAPTTATAAPPPITSSVDQWNCYAVGSTGAWYGAGYHNGIYVWGGPKRFFKSSALGDCRSWLSRV